MKTLEEERTKAVEFGERQQQVANDRAVEIQELKRRMDELEEANRRGQPAPPPPKPPSGASASQTDPYESDEEKRLRTELAKAKKDLDAALAATEAAGEALAAALAREP